MKFRKNLGKEYSPLYFLASLGNGGLVITFFMYLMFMVPHKGHPIPTFMDILKSLGSGRPLTIVMAVIGICGIIYFAVDHFRVLFWNMSEFKLFKSTEKYRELKNSNAEVQLMSIPLTYAMAINVAFILGAVFVPYLWKIVEFLFPLALIGFLVVGVYAVVIFLDFFSRVLAHGQFDCEKNNSLSQMLSVFAFSMVAVGFSATGAMSHVPLISGTGLLLAVAFLSFTILLGVIKIVLGFRAMFEHGVNEEAVVSLWIIIPILTVMGITFYRISMGLHHNFGLESHPWDQAILFTVITSLQVFFGALGYRVMRRTGYCKTFITGENKSVTAYAAICPGVAFFVMGNFMINKGLVPAGLLTKYSFFYILWYLPLIYIQFKTIKTLFRLNDKLLKDSDNSTV